MKFSDEFFFILKPSTVSGVGVFAAIDIPAHTVVLSDPKTVIFSIVHKDDLPEVFRQYCVRLDDTMYRCPEKFNRMEIGWYVNHSETPNITRNAQGRFCATRDIKKDEEILMDYNELYEPEHLKEEYYKKKT